jgi:hypothetical protein
MAGLVPAIHAPGWGRAKAWITGTSPVMTTKNRGLRTRRRELLARFESVLPDVLSALERGEALIEVI